MVKARARRPWPSFPGTTARQAAANLLTVGVLVFDLYNVTFGGPVEKEREEAGKACCESDAVLAHRALGLPVPRRPRLTAEK